MGNNNSKHKLRGIFNKSLMNEVAKLRDEVGLGENEGLIGLDRKGLEEEKRSLQNKWMISTSSRAMGKIRSKMENQLLYGNMDIIKAPSWSSTERIELEVYPPRPEWGGMRASMLIDPSIVPPLSPCLPPKMPGRPTPTGPGPLSPNGPGVPLSEKSRAPGTPPQGPTGPAPGI